MRDLMKNVPPGILAICITVLIVGFGFASFWLAYKGIDDTQFRGNVILLVSLLNSLLSGGALLTASAAQRQTNGQSIDSKESNNGGTR